VPVDSDEGLDERGDKSSGRGGGLKLKFGPSPCGVIFPFSAGMGRGGNWTPWRRFAYVGLPNGNVAVVGVSGGDEGPACWEKLKLGVAGRIVATCAIFMYGIVRF